MDESFMKELDVNAYEDIHHGLQDWRKTEVIVFCSICIRNDQVIDGAVLLVFSRPCVLER
jgi:hypothetical protein